MSGQVTAARQRGSLNTLQTVDGFVHSTPLCVRAYKALKYFKYQGNIKAEINRTAAEEKHSRMHLGGASMGLHLPDS